MSTTVHVTQQQRQILRYFQDLEKDLVYYPVNVNLPVEGQLISRTSNKSIQSQQSPIASKLNKQNSQKSQQPAPTYFNTQQLLNFTNSQLSHSSPQHAKLLHKLQDFKHKSSQIHTVSLLLHEYDTNFKHLQNERVELLKQLQVLHSSTSELIYKQKKYIDLSNTLKEALDYYEVLDKFQFNWQCQVSAREMFEDQLQSLLSGLTDGIEFFTLNTNYTNSKKYLNGLISSKTKVTSFTKSFFIKLLNKQYGFSLKYTKNLQLHKTIQNLYPKSKPKFLTEFITAYPQFQKQIKVILLSAKQSSNESQSNHLLRRQTQIQEFLLNDSSLSLITYLQKNIPEVYEEVILKFISFYRTSFHENYHKRLLQSVEKDKLDKFQQYFRQIFIQSVFILTCQAAYLQYCFRPVTQLAKQYTKGTLTKISQYYSSLLSKLARQPGKNKDPFKICNELSYILEQSDKFLRNYTSKQYQTYAVGAIIHYVEEFGVDILKSIFQRISSKIKSQLETVCQNMLPKYKQTYQKNKLTQQIKQFVQLIPNLQYCPSQAQKYLITTLDIIIKSVKQVSARIESRLECYAWNLQIFALIDSSLEKLPYSLVKKEMKINVGQTTRMIERVRNVNRTENLMKYASDLFSVIRTGVPTLSQLTLDFHTFIKQYFTELRQKFVKDMVFIYAKNVIQFLQTLKQSQKKSNKSIQQPTSQLSPKISQPKQKTQQQQQYIQLALVKNLHSSYKLSIDNFINHANNILELREKQFAIYPQGEELLQGLLREVQENLLELMGTFYVEVSKNGGDTANFQNIKQIRLKLEAGKQNKKLENR